MIIKNEKPPKWLNAQQRQIWSVFNRARNQAIQKNNDYGGSVFESPLIVPGMRPESAILVRISDKIRRAIRLIAGCAAMVSESLRDTMMDLGTYCFLWVVLDEMKSGEMSICVSCAKNGTTCPVPSDLAGDDAVRQCVEYVRDDPRAKNGKVP